MPLRILIYGKEGDGNAFSAMAQIRALINEMRVDANIQYVSNESQMKASGVDELPAVFVDGSMVSMGYTPTRTEMERAIRMRMEATSVEE